MTRISISALVLVTCLAGAARAQAQDKPEGLSPHPPAAIRLTLDEAIARGFETSHRLAEIRAREQGAQAAVRGAQVADKPLVSATAGYTRTNHVPEFGFLQPSGNRVVVYPDIPDNVVTRVAFQWPIYTSGRADALERVASAEAQAIAADIETARADLRLEIVRAYWAVATAREAVRVLEEAATRADAQVNDSKRRFEVGLIPPNEVSSLEAQRSRERAQLIEASNFRESTLIDLRRLIGVDPSTVIDLVDRLDAPNPSNPSNPVTEPAVTQRPELMALALRLGGLKARQQAAMTGNKPTIGLGGGVDYGNPNPRIFPRKGEWQESWDVSVTVSWTFWDSGRTKAQVAEAEAAVAATRERIAELDSLVAAEVRQRQLDIDSTAAMVRAASDAVVSAAEARRVIADRFNAGVATSTDVLVAQVALLESELARTRAFANVRLAEARLHRALGKP